MCKDTVRVQNCGRGIECLGLVGGMVLDHARLGLSAPPFLLGWINVASVHWACCHCVNKEPLSELHEAGQAHTVEITNLMLEGTSLGHYREHTLHTHLTHTPYTHTHTHAHQPGNTNLKHHWHELWKNRSSYRMFSVRELQYIKGPSLVVLRFYPWFLWFGTVGNVTLLFVCCVLSCIKLCNLSVINRDVFNCLTGWLTD